MGREKGTERADRVKKERGVFYLGGLWQRTAQRWWCARGSTAVVVFDDVGVVRRGRRRRRRRQGRGGGAPAMAHGGCRQAVTAGLDEGFGATD
ncbi:hypothetical protein U1Q18_001462 [Sarracenia purpurea var. burkii]